MKTITLSFRIHQPFNLKRYRFFEIGQDHFYYDDYSVEGSVRHAVEQCYLPANNTLLRIIDSSKGKFKVSFSITGLALEQFQQYAPEVIDSFRELAKTGAVDFIATPYAHSLASIYNTDEFVRQVKLQSEKIEELFGIKPTVFANSGLVYSDEIGDIIAGMGYKVACVENAKHIMGWKSPNYVYHHVGTQKLKLAVRNNKLSDDITYNFSNWQWDQFPLTAEKFISWIKTAPEEEEIFNLFTGYEIIGLLNNHQSGIFEFLSALPYCAMEQGIKFATVAESFEKAKPTGGVFTATYPISWTDEEKDLTAWTGNELQYEALHKLYALTERVNLCKDPLIKLDWQRLQDNAHFYYMTTKHYSSAAIRVNPIPYESPYDAFMNYMNVLSDFIERVESQYPTSIDNEELNALLKTIDSQEKKIADLEAQIEAASSAPKAKPARKSTTKVAKAE